MGLAQEITEAPESLLDDLANFIKSECALGTDTDGVALPMDPEEIVSALKAWAYMHLNAPGMD